MEAPVDSIEERKRLLLLVRHGRAVPKGIGLSDFERTLTLKGIEETGNMAAETAAGLPSVDLLISSPAARALETAHIFARHLKYPVKEIRAAGILYSADSIRPVVSYLQELNSTADRVAVFGHNPLFEELAAYFIAGFMRPIPKSSVLSIEFRAGSWDEISGGAGHLHLFLTP